MLKEEKFEKLRQKALRFLSFRPRSEKEIRNFLSGKTKNPKNIKLLLDELKDQNLINDSEFSDWWVDQRLSFNSKGKRIIRGELMAKGVDKDLIDEKLAGIGNRQLEKSALDLIKRKALLYTGKKKIEQKDKLVKHLLRRGFDYGLSKKLVDEWLENS